MAPFPCLERTMACAYLPQAMADEREFRIEALGGCCRAVRGPRGLHHPGLQRLRA